jgi:predicted DNA-binding transcriptional regulator YafY
MQAVKKTRVQYFGERRLSMRADRLLSILMILQTGRRVKAEQLAEELEVSVRTIYRDITALCTWGVPVYCERGPGGGIELLERYRTDLTGLSTDEARALFMLSIPTPLDELGVAGELKAAMLKLVAALPSSRSTDPQISRQRIHLDWAPWFYEQEPQPHLKTIQKAVWQDQKIETEYFTEAGKWLGSIKALVCPYGLVAKSGRWYLVARQDLGNFIVVRVSWIAQARLLDENFQRPENFDLGAFWKAWRIEYEARKPHFPVKVRVPANIMDSLPTIFGENIQSDIDAVGPADSYGWRTLSLPFETFEDARQRLLSLGGAVEVIEPLALRMSLIDYAEQILERYKVSGES